ncbi:hypothetical protein MCEMSE15_00218 [Fimbriimonadaceae bacterium]
MVGVGRNTTTLHTVYRLASRFVEAGIFNKQTMREYDALCLKAQNDPVRKTDSFTDFTRSPNR